MITDNKTSFDEKPKDTEAQIDQSSSIRSPTEKMAEEGAVSDVASYDSSSVSTVASRESFLKQRFKRHFQTGMPLYKRPRARYKWGQKQAYAHHVWASLFFDLSYVGVAFQLSHLMLDGVQEERILASLGLFIALFASLEMCWQVKMTYDARYVANSLFHRIQQIILGGIVSLAANSVARLEVMENPGEYSNTLTFSCCMFAFHVVDSIPYFEMMFSKLENVRGAAYIGIWGKVSLLAIYGASIATSVYSSLWVSALFWFLGGNWLRFFILFINITKTVSRKNSVPIHVNWAIHRYNEFLLLMIGESVISIIIASYSNTPNFIVTFLLSYLLVATLALMVFATGVHSDDQHALRRSSLRAAAFLLLNSVQSMCLILVGVGFKQILLTVEAIPTATLTWFMSTSLAACLLALMFGRMQHHGFHEEFIKLPTREMKQKRILFWTLKLILVGIIFTATPMNAPPYAIIIWYWGITTLVYIVQLVDLSTFEEYHCEQIQQEVQNRIQKYRKEGFEVEEHKGEHSHDHGHSHAGGSHHNHSHSHGHGHSHDDHFHTHEDE